MRERARERTRGSDEWKQEKREEQASDMNSHRKRERELNTIKRNSEVFVQRFNHNRRIQCDRIKIEVKTAKKT